MMFLLLAALAAATPTSSSTRLYVADPVGVEPAIARALSSSLAAELTQTGMLSALTTADVENLAGFAARQQQLGCSDVGACMAELGNALGVAFVVATSVTVVDGTQLVAMTLSEVDRAQVVGREAATATSTTMLLEESRRAVRRLVSPLLSQGAGVLSVTASEEGAEVRLDGRLVGIAPLSSLSVPGGRHEVMVTKDGFVDVRADHIVPPSGALSLRALLSPSTATADAWRDRVGRAHLVGGVVSAGGVLAAVGGGVLLGVNLQRADELKQTADGQITADEQQVFVVRDVAGVSLLSAGAAAVVAGVVAFVLAGDGDRYEGLVGQPSRLEVSATAP